MKKGRAAPLHTVKGDHTIMQEILEAIVQGVVQGATEFLPVSSSGHLSLAQHFMGVQNTSLLFNVMLHLGTLAAVVLVYRKLIWRLLKALVSLVRDLFTGKFRWKHMDPDRNLLVMLFFGLLPLFLLFLPVPGTGMKIKDYADLWGTDSSILIEGLALLATSVLLLLGHWKSRQTAEKAERKAAKKGGRPVVGRRRFRLPDALAVGVTQCFAAVFPGLSRSGSTLSVGLLRGINRQAALDYSFVLGIPAIVAAAGLELLDAVKAQEAVSVAPLVVGMLVSAVVGFFAIKLLRWMVSSNQLIPFAVYTAVLGIAVVVIAVIEANTGVNIVTGMPL